MSNLESRADYLSDSIVRISVVPAGNFSYNKFLILADKPALIHTGRVQWFDETWSRVSEFINPSCIEVITFSHVEADECGAMNRWLERAPHAQVVHGKIAKASLEDFAIRPPRIVNDGKMINLGNRQLMLLETPHFPHNWEACLFYEPESKTLFCSDLGANLSFPNLYIEDDQELEDLLKFQKKTGYLVAGASISNSLNRLRTMDIECLAIHHGASIRGKKIISRFFDRLEMEVGSV